nr:unnamed protein product [Callosobruchus chinensis]
MYSIIRNVNQLRLPVSTFRFSHIPFGVAQVCFQFRIAKNTLPSLCTPQHTVRFKHAETKSHHMNVAALQSVHKNHFKPICSRYLNGLHHTRSLCRYHKGVTDPARITYKTHLKYHSFFGLGGKKKSRQLKEPRTVKDTVEEHNCINKKQKPKTKRRKTSNVETVSSTLKLTNTVNEIKKKKTLIKRHGINKISNFIFKQLDCKFCMEGKDKPKTGGSSWEKRAFSTGKLNLKFENKKDAFKKDDYEFVEGQKLQDRQDTSNNVTLKSGKDCTLTQNPLKKQEVERGEASTQKRAYSTIEVTAKFEAKKDEFKKKSYEILDDPELRNLQYASTNATPKKRRDYKEILFTQNSLIKKEHSTPLIDLFQKSNPTIPKKAFPLKYNVNTSNAVLTGNHSQTSVIYKYVDRQSNARRSKSLDDFLCRKKMVEGNNGEINPHIVSDVLKAAKRETDPKTALAVTIAVEQLEKTLKIYLGDHLSQSKDCSIPKTKSEIKDPNKKIEIEDPMTYFSKMDPKIEKEVIEPCIKRDEIKEPCNDEFVILSKPRKKGKSTKRKREVRKSSKSSGGGERNEKQEELFEKKEKPCEEELPSKKNKLTCNKKEDPCKKQEKSKQCEISCKKMEDPCKKADQSKKEDPCKKAEAKKQDTACEGIPKKEDPCNKKKEPAVCYKKNDCPEPPLKEDKCSCFPSAKASSCDKSPYESASSLPSPFKVSDPRKHEPCPKPCRTPKPPCPDEGPFKPPPCKDLSKDHVVLISRKDPCQPCPPKSPPPRTPDPCRVSKPNVKPAEVKCNKCNVSGEAFLRNKNAESKEIGPDYCKQVPMPEDCPMSIDCSDSTPRQMTKPTCQMQRSCSKPSMDPKSPPNSCISPPPPEPRLTGAEGRFKGRVVEITPESCSKQKSCHAPPPFRPNDICDAPSTPQQRKEESKCNLKNVAPNPACVPSKTDLRYCQKKQESIEKDAVPHLKPHPCPIPEPAIKPQEEIPCITTTTPKCPQQALKKDWLPVQIGDKRPKAKIMRPVCRPKSCPPATSSPPKQPKKIVLSAEPPKPLVQKKGIIDSCKGIINSVCSVFCPGKGGSSGKKASAGINVAMSRSLPEFRSTDAPGYAFSDSGSGSGNGGKPKKKPGFMFFAEDSKSKCTDGEEGVKGLAKEAGHKNVNEVFNRRRSVKKQRMIDHVSLCSTGRKRRNTIKLPPKPLTPTRPDIQDPCKKKDDAFKKKEDPCKQIGSDKVKWNQFESCREEEKGDSGKGDPCKKKEGPSEKRKDPCQKKEDLSKSQIDQQVDKAAMKKECANLSYLTKKSQKDSTCEEKPSPPKPKPCPPPKKAGPPELKEMETSDCLKGGTPPKKEDPCKKKPEPPKKKPDPCKKRDEKKRDFQLKEPPKDDCSLKTGTPPKKEDPWQKKLEPAKKKEDPCKMRDPSKKKEDPCKKKEDPCKKKEDPYKKKEDPCKMKEDPCKKREDPCKKKEDHCKKGEDPSKPKEDPCRKKGDPCAKKEDPCKKKEDPCKKGEDASKPEEDPCKKKEDPCAKKEDPSKKKEDPCKMKKEPCEDFNKKQAHKDPCAKKDPYK